MLIARLTAQLRCYLPEPVDETWGRLRHLGARREQLLDEHVACVQQIRDLLECVWPAAVTTAQQPFKSHTWVAAMHVIMTRDGGDFTRTRRLGPARFEHAVRKELTRRGKIRPCLRILRNLYAALADPAGVIAHRRGAFERIGWLIEDWDTARAKLADTEARMVAVLDDLRADRAGLLDPGPLPGRGRRDPRRDRRPAPLHQLPRGGQARRPGTPRTDVRHLRRPRPAHRRRPTAPADRGLARGLGCREEQPRLRRPLPAPDHPRDQQAQADPGPDRRSPARSCASSTPSSPPARPGTPTSPPTAPDASRRHSRRSPPDTPTRRASTSWVGASLPRH